MNASDARVRYTRMVIRHSFLELLEEKPVSKITVTEICQRSQINRATFYKHYTDPFDLLEQIEADILHMFQEALRKREYREMRAFLIDLLEQTKKVGENCRAIGSENGDPALATKIFLLCYRSVYPILERKLPQMPESQRQMLYYYLSQGCGGVLAYWMNTGMRESPEAVADFIQKASTGLMQQFSPS